MFNNTLCNYSNTLYYFPYIYLITVVAYGNEWKRHSIWKYLIYFLELRVINIVFSTEYIEQWRRVLIITWTMSRS